MKRLITAITISMSVISASIAGLHNEIGDTVAELPEAMPHLSLDSMYIDLGTISHDSIAEGVMRFCNTGNAPLAIIRIYSECGCTVPSFSSTPVAPGDSGEIKIRFNGRKRTSSGPFRKSMRIRTNAGNPREILVVKGRILPHTSHEK